MNRNDWFRIIIEVKDIIQVESNVGHLKNNFFDTLCRITYTHSKFNFNFFYYELYSIKQLPY